MSCHLRHCYRRASTNKKHHHKRVNAKLMYCCKMASISIRHCCRRAQMRANSSLTWPHEGYHIKLPYSYPLGKHLALGIQEGQLKSKLSSSEDLLRSTTSMTQWASMPIN
jgi:hypothetical protein